MYLLFAFANLCTASHISPLMSFSTMSNILGSVNFISTSVFFFSNMPVMPVPVLKETEQDVVHESLSNCFRTFGINL